MTDLSFDPWTLYRMSGQKFEGYLFCMIIFHLQLLLNKQPSHKAEQLVAKPQAAPTAQQEHIVHRYHPTTKYENLTINCCERCVGDLLVVWLSMQWWSATIRGEKSSDRLSFFRSVHPFAALELFFFFFYFFIMRWNCYSKSMYQNVVPLPTPCLNVVLNSGVCASTMWINIKMGSGENHW